MNTLNFLIALVFVISPGSRKPECKDHGVSVVSKKMDVFRYKVCQDYIGATLEIYTEKNTLIASQKITAEAGFVDFYMEEPGKYIIKFNDGVSSEKFTFTKRLAPPITMEHLTHHVVIAQD